MQLSARHQWLTPVILATQEAETRRIMVHETYLEKSFTKNRVSGVAQGKGSEFKPQYHREKKKNAIVYIQTSHK
jgi:hypothetical protein